MRVLRMRLLAHHDSMWETTDEDMRVRPNRSLVHFHNCTNAHDVNPFFLNDRCLKWGMNVTLLI